MRSFSMQMKHRKTSARLSTVCGFLSLSSLAAISPPAAAPVLPLLGPGTGGEQDLFLSRSAMSSLGPHSVSGLEMQGAAAAAGASSASPHIPHTLALSCRQWWTGPRPELSSAPRHVPALARLDTADTGAPSPAAGCSTHSITGHITTPILL